MACKATPGVVAALILFPLDNLDRRKPSRDRINLPVKSRGTMIPLAWRLRR